jgi:hypothetical protein
MRKNVCQRNSVETRSTRHGYGVTEPRHCQMRVRCLVRTAGVELAPQSDVCTLTHTVACAGQEEGRCGAVCQHSNSEEARSTRHGYGVTEPRHCQMRVRCLVRTAGVELAPQSDVCTLTHTVACAGQEEGRCGAVCQHSNSVETRSTRHGYGVTEPRHCQMRVRCLVRTAGVELACSRECSPTK